MKALGNTSDENLIRLTHAAERIAPKFKPEISKVRKMFKDKAPAYFLAQKALKEIHPNVRKKMVQNFMINYILLGPKNRDMAFKLQELGNIAPAISIEGFKKETDERRGKGVWEKVMQAMDNCKEVRLIYGFSITPTRYNTEIVYSDELMKLLTKEKGCAFGWCFTYIPISKNPDVSLMQTPEQRFYGWRRVNYLRNKYPVFIGDFWNDGMHVGGCIAGGRDYYSCKCKKRL